VTSEERQAALNSISPEDLAKIQFAGSKSVTVEIEDLLVAEFAMKFGWEAFRDYDNNLVSPDKFMRLLVASRKLDSLAQYRRAQAAFIGAGSSQSKKPSQTFKTMTSSLMKDAEADK